jgi:hypothetical protein
LHLWKFSVISLLRTNFAEMPGKTQQPGSREQNVFDANTLRFEDFKGDAVVRVSRLRRQP